MAEERQYRCRVEIDVEATTPEGAAQQAEMLLREAMQGLVVEVWETDDSGQLIPGRKGWLIDNQGELPTEEI